MENIEIKNEIAAETGMRKYTTNIEGVFVYYLNSGWNWKNSILKNENDELSEWFGEKSIHIEFSEYIDGAFVGKETIFYNGLDEKYVLKR